MVRGLAVSGALLVAVAGACDSPFEAHPPPAPALTGPGPFIVSNPVQLNGVPTAFVSLSHAQQPVLKVTIRVRRTAKDVIAYPTAQGLDPIPVPALAGDTLVLTVDGTSGPSSPLVFTVPSETAPVVVRTRPASDQVDVASHAPIQVVFSKPLASDVPGSDALQLVTEQGGVEGHIEFANPWQTTLSFVPDRRLVAGTVHELVVSAGIRDLDGMATAGPLSVHFTTARPVAQSFLVSNPVSVANGDSMAYVSRLPNTLLGVFSVTIRNPRTGSELNSVALFQGGFDPFPISAGTGDILQVTLRHIDGRITTEQVIVPAWAPPVVVRVEPQGTSVALNDRLTVVVSEPVDPASLPEALELREVAGTVALDREISFGNPEQTVIHVTPAQEFRPGVAYQLVRPHTIYDLDGDFEGSLLTSPTFTAAAGLLQEIAFVRGGQIYRAGPDGIRRLTGPDGTSWDPAWSPDGRRLAFTSDRADGEWNIYTMNADGSQVVRRTTTTGTEPAWSPDGRTIAFSRGHVMLIDADGPAGPGIDLTPDRFGVIRYPAWSPDGEKIVFSSDWNGYDVVFDLWTMNRDGSNIQVLANAPIEESDYLLQAAWSPDGRSLAFVQEEWSWSGFNPEAIVVVTRWDPQESRVIARTGSYARPTWSPDGSTIAFGTTSCHPCRSSILVQRVDGGSSTVIIDDGHSPAWRPLQR